MKKENFEAFSVDKPSPTYSISSVFKQTETFIFKHRFIFTTLIVIFVFFILPTAFDRIIISNFYQPESITVAKKKWVKIGKLDKFELYKINLYLQGANNNDYFLDERELNTRDLSYEFKNEVNFKKEIQNKFILVNGKYFWIDFGKVKQYDPSAKTVSEKSIPEIANYKIDTSSLMSLSNTYGMLILEYNNKTTNKRKDALVKIYSFNTIENWSEVTNTLKICGMMCGFEFINEFSPQKYLISQNFGDACGGWRSFMIFNLETSQVSNLISTTTGCGKMSNDSQMEYLGVIDNKLLIAPYISKMDEDNISYTVLYKSLYFFDTDGNKELLLTEEQMPKGTSSIGVDYITKEIYLGNENKERYTYDLITRQILSTSKSPNIKKSDNYYDRMIQHTEINDILKYIRSEKIIQDTSWIYEKPLYVNQNELFYKQVKYVEFLSLVRLRNLLFSEKILTDDMNVRFIYQEEGSSLKTISDEKYGRIFDVRIENSKTNISRTVSMKIDLSTDEIFMEEE